MTRSESQTDAPLEPDKLHLLCQGWGARSIAWLPQERRFAGAGRNASITSWLAQGPQSTQVPSHTPSADDWREFWLILDNIDAWNWKGSYNCGTVCGTPFWLEISVAGRQIRSGGNLAGDDAPPNWRLFDRALCALSGGSANFDGRIESLRDLCRLSECVRDATIAPESVPGRLETLIDDNVDVCGVVGDLITRLGERARTLVPVLAKHLARDRQFAAGLARIGQASAAALPQLVALIRSPQCNREAIAAIVAIGSETPDVVSAFSHVAIHGRPDLRVEAIEALCAISDRCDGHWAVLDAGLDDEDASIRRGTVHSLRFLKGSGVAAICKGLQDPDATVRQQALSSLRSIGKEAHEALPALLDLLSHPDGTTRRGAISCLSQVATSAEVLPSLRRMLYDAERDVRGSAALALGEFGTAAEEALPDLLNAFQQDGALTFVAVLKQVSSDIEDLLCRLEALLASNRPQVRQNVLLALRSVGGTSARSVALIVKSLDDEDPRVRDSAAGNLFDLPADVAEAAIPALSKALYDPFVRATAANALGSIGLPAPEAIAALSDVLEETVRAGAGGVDTFCVARALLELSPEFRQQLDSETVHALERYG